MKSTGVTRKIDNLGRIVIPKEIRKNLGIREGESLEIYTEEESIIFKKHSQIKKFTDLGVKLSDLINSIFDVEIIITDRENILVANQSELINNSLDDFLINLIDNRESFVGKLDKKILNGYYTITPIIAESDSLGLVIIKSKDNTSYEKIAKLIARILAEKINIY